MPPGQSATRSELTNRAGSGRRSLLPGLCLWVGFLGFSLLHAPIPGVNEPHYLTKSLHSWDSTWCAGDFFLESSNAHLVFYRTVGLLTLVFSFPVSAFIGRVMAYLLLAVAWQKLCKELSGDRWTGCFAAAVFLLISSSGNFSGEWLVGGVEAKVFSYGFVLAGIGTLLSGARWQAGLLLGAGVAMHPLVGLWSVIAMVMAAALILAGQQIRESGGEVITALRRFIRQPDVIAAMVLFLTVSSAGVVPALSSVLSADPTLSFQANYIQVFYRLPHHLDPMRFKAAAYVGYFLLAMLACLLHRFLRSDGPDGAALKFLTKTVLCSGIIALTGVLIGWGPRPPVDMPYYEFRMNLLKFYPFRLFDVALPILVSIQISMLLSSRRLLSVMLPSKLRPLMVAGCFATALFLNAGRGSIDRMTDAQREDWTSACCWIGENTPEGSLILTPKESRSFKWLAERAEYVAFKDCPQDAAGIVEWNNRLKFLRKWGEDNWNGSSYSATVTQQLHELTGVDYLVTKRWGPFDAPVVYQNNTYRIYQINELN